MPKFPVSDHEVADYLLLAEAVDLPEAGVFGAFLDTKGEGVVISDFTERSSGREAGMQKQDRILAIDTVTIENYADLKLAMLDKRPGDKISVELERPVESGEPERISLQVQLGSREPPKNPHGP
jgi:predicted metalloprotease with PDZ domain